MEHSSSSLRIYYMVYAALLGLLILTVLIAQLKLGAFGIFLALTIATIKGLLVVLYFMHLRDSSRLTWVFAAAGFVWLFILLAFTMTDYLSRGWVGS